MFKLTTGFSLMLMRRHLWCGVVLLGAAMLLAFVLPPGAFPYSPDSADYIEQARSLHAHGAALATPYDLNQPDVVREPSRLFPVGFPIVLALLSTFGVEPSVGAVLVNGIAAVLIPVILFLALRPSCGPRLAAIAAILCATTPGLILNATFGMSDCFALALSLLVFHLAVNAKSSGMHLLAGAVAAFAYVSRNALIALLLASMIFHVWMVFEHRLSRESRRQLLGFVSGCLVVLVPYVLRNLAVYGTINPYAMGESTIGLAENASAMLAALAYDLSAVAAFQLRIEPLGVAGFALLLAATISIPLLLASGRRLFTERQRRAMVFGTAYVLIGLWMVVVARTRYQWGETIGIRHSLQYTPYILGMACIVIATMLRGRGGTPRFAAGLSIVFLAALLLVHVRFYSNQLHQADVRNSMAGGQHVYRSGQDFLCGRDEGTFLVSNWAYVFRIRCGVPARHIWIVDPAREKSQPRFVGTESSYHTLKEGLDAAARNAAGRPLFVALFPGRGGLSRADFPMADEDTAALRREGWTLVTNAHEKILLER